MTAINTLPPLSTDTVLTDCCARFDPKPWDDQTIIFKDQPFARATTRSIFYMPLNIAKVIARTWKCIDDVNATDAAHRIMLTQELSPWKADQFFWLDRPVPCIDVVTLSGTYRTKVFEGPYKNAKEWVGQLNQIAKDAGKEPAGIMFYYTTCPKCAKAYGKNYVVGFVRID